MKSNSLWCAVVDEAQTWSSPASASTPPWAAVPARLACLKTSMVRSTPGPLPYQMAKTPSCFAPGKSPTCCVPQSAVAAVSSFTPGWKCTRCASTNRFACQSARSKLPSGEPR